MKKIFASLFALMICSIGPAYAEKAHVHGYGTLNIAVEGNVIEMELEAPGSDIVGFEYAAQTKADKAKLMAAKKALGAPLELFRLSSAAVCETVSVDVHYTKEHDDGAHKGHEHGITPNDKASKHGEFYALYKFTCANAGALSAIRFGYFNSFEGADTLKVNVITPTGQKQFEITRDAAALDLSELM